MKEDIIGKEIEFEGTPKETKPRKASWWNINTFLLLAILIICVVLTSYVVKYYDEFSTDPLLYGAEQFHVRDCSCVTTSGAFFFFNQTTVWQVKKAAKVNIEEINLSGLLD